jgi:thioredoxin reductase
MDFDWDCIVVGAGPAGLSAALTLGRARRRVLVLDAGTPRNAAAREMHGVLGHDGLDPAALRARGVEEVGRYGIEVHRGDAVGSGAELVDGGIALNGHRARTLIIATGLHDETPAIDGFDAIYGISAHTCPYCDGWEHRDTRIAVLTPVFGGAHLGKLLRQWSREVVVLTDGGPGVDADGEAELRAVGVEVVRERIAAFEHEAGALRSIAFADADRAPLPADALFFHVGLQPKTELARALGCALGDGGFITADPATRVTSVDRVYAIGNCADPMMNVPMVIADGARAAVGINVRLLDEVALA